VVLSIETTLVYQIGVSSTHAPTEIASTSLMIYLSIYLLAIYPPTVQLGLHAFHHGMIDKPGKDDETNKVESFDICFSFSLRMPDQVVLLYYHFQMYTIQYISYMEMKQKHAPFVSCLYLII